QLLLGIVAVRRHRLPDVAMFGERLQGARQSSNVLRRNLDRCRREMLVRFYRGLPVNLGATGAGSPAQRRGGPARRGGALAHVGGITARPKLEPSHLAPRG